MKKIILLLLGILIMCGLNTIGQSIYMFSVSDSEKVCFSPGNLQWSATNGGNTATTHIVAGNGTAAGTWRFAPNQWDTIGARNVDSSYFLTGGWIDLFGWGTSGYNNRNPYMRSTNDIDYANDTNDICGTNYDWGVYNAIYNPKTNTTDAPGTWRTLTSDEWKYLFNRRSTITNIRYAFATVCGVPGLIIVPDNCNSPLYPLSYVNQPSLFASNFITAPDWACMEAVGCVFLPGAGYRSSLRYSNYKGNLSYWSASTFPNRPDLPLSKIQEMKRTTSLNLYVLNGGSGMDGDTMNMYYFGKSCGYSVRLVRNLHGATLNTKIVNNITSTTAQSGGNITSDGGATVTARGVCWSTSQNPTINDNHTSDGSGTGNFTSTMTGLKANTIYYVRAYATNAIGTAYGNQITFTTTAMLPTLTTITISNITATSAKSGGNITSDGGNSVIARGVCWSTTHNPTISDNHTFDGSGIGSFTSSIIGLTAGTTYYVRAYAANATGTAYGNELVLKTTSTIGIKDVVNVNSIAKIYPNPAKSQITITGLEQSENIQIINTIGQVVKQYNNVQETIIINIADLSRGIYFVRIGNYVKKLLVE